MTGDREAGPRRQPGSAARALRRALPVVLFVTLAAAADASRQDPAAAAVASVFPIEARWVVPLAGRPSAPPTVDRDRVFVPLAEGSVEALDLDTGAPLWSVPLEAEWPIAAGDGLAFVALVDGLSAIDRSGGQERWRASIGGLAAAPVWRAGWLIATTVSGEAIALRASDGEIVWRRALDAPAAGSAFVEADRLYVPLSDGRVVASRIETGEPVWEARLGGPARAVLALPDRVYAGSLDNRFYCLSAADGRTEWQWRTGGDVIERAAADDDQVYVVSLDNLLYALDRRTGVRRWRTPLPGRAVGPPSMAGPSVFVPVAGQALLFAPARRGARLARIPLPGDLFVASAVDTSRHVTLVVAVVGTGRAVLAGFGRAPHLTATPPTEMPGVGFNLLARQELPVRYLALPAQRRPGA